MTLRLTYIYSVKMAYHIQKDTFIAYSFNFKHFFVGHI